MIVVAVAAMAAIVAPWKCVRIIQNTVNFNILSSIYANINSLRSTKWIEPYYYQSSVTFYLFEATFQGWRPFCLPQNMLSSASYFFFGMIHHPSLTPIPLIRCKYAWNQYTAAHSIDSIEHIVLAKMLWDLPNLKIESHAVSPIKSILHGNHKLMTDGTENFKRMKSTHGTLILPALSFNTPHLSNVSTPYSQHHHNFENDSAMKFGSEPKKYLI